MSARTLATVVLIGLILAGVWIVASGRPLSLAARNAPCWPGTMALALASQSVPAAAYVPCLQGGPGAWQVRHVTIDSTATKYELALGRDTTWTVSLESSCDVARAEGPDEVDYSTLVLKWPYVYRFWAGDGSIQHYSWEISVEFAHRIDYYVVPGGCITSDLDIDVNSRAALPDAMLMVESSLRLIGAPSAEAFVNRQDG